MSTVGAIGPGRRRLFTLVVPLLVAFCALGATLALARLLVARERMQLQRRTEAETNHVAAQLRSAVLNSLENLPMLAEWWLSQGRPESPEDWETDAKIFLTRDASLREAVWLDATGSPVWCVRPGTTPDFHCHLQEPEFGLLAQQARTLGTIALSQVLVRNGVSRLYACQPVHRGRLVGFIAAGFDAASLISALLNEKMPADYELRIGANGQPVVTLKRAAGPLWMEGASNSEVHIANRWWSVKLIPAAGDIQTLNRIVWSFGLTVAVLLYTCTALALVYKHNESRLRAEVEERSHAQETITGLNRDLQNQLADFQTLLEVLPVGIAVSRDPACRDIWVNPQLAAMLRVPIEENISLSAPDASRMPYRMVRHGADVPAEELPMQVAARSGQCVLGMDLDVIRSDGSVLHTLSYSAPVFDQEGKIRHVIDVCVDITDRKALEDRLLQSEKDRSLALMAGGIAHDFNNLLTVIIGQTELARRDIPSSRVAARALTEASAAAQRAADLVAQLLAYTGRSWFTLGPLDLSAQIGKLSERIREMVPPAIEIRFDLAAAMPLVNAGAPEVEQVVRNLVENAVEAIGEAGGTIQVSTFTQVLGPSDLSRHYSGQPVPSGTYVCLEVSDSGAGLAGDLAARVFDPFFTTKFTGRGLGLSAVKGIMRAHGGGVRFEANSSDGACVRAIFPAVTVQAAAR